MPRGLPTRCSTIWPRARSAPTPNWCTRHRVSSTTSRRPRRSARSGRSTSAAGRHRASPPRRSPTCGPSRGCWPGASRGSCCPAGTAPGRRSRSGSPNEDGRLEVLQDLYRRWPFFRTVLSNMAQVLAKSDMGLAAHYAELVEDEALRRRVFDKIVAEHERTIRMHQADHRPRRPARRQPGAGPLGVQPLPVSGAAEPPAGRAAAAVPLRRRRRTRPARHPADDERPGHRAAQQRLAPTHISNIAVRARRAFSRRV